MEGEEQAEATKKAAEDAAAALREETERGVESRKAEAAGELTRLHTEAEQRLASAEEALTDARGESERIRREAA